jgi:hypothetical protein
VLLTTDDVDDDVIAWECSIFSSSSPMYEKMLLVVLRRGYCTVVDEWNLREVSDDGGTCS